MKKISSLYLQNFQKKALKHMHGGNPVNTTIFGQLLETFGIVVIVSVVLQTLQSNFQLLKKYQNMAVDIYPLTYNTQQIFLQDPSSCFPILEQSKNERSGAEYSYSCFIFSDGPSVNKCEPNQQKVQHIFHKGSPSIFPLMAPGVFMKSDNNVLRIYHNSSTKWNNYVDIPNIPVKKWVHLVVTLKGQSLDIYINGNLANRMKFNDVPKLNYNDFYLLYEKLTEQNTNPQADSLLNFGKLNGYVSRMKYFAYALSYTQIDKLLREGPHKTLYEKKNSLEQSSFQVGFLQTDDWMTSADHSGLGPQ